MIFDTVELLDFLKKNREENKVRSKETQLEFINNVPPDPTLLETRAKKKILQY